MGITFILSQGWTIALAFLCLSSALLTLISLWAERLVPAARIATPPEWYGTILYGFIFGFTLLWAAFYQGDPRIVRAVFRFELWGAFLMINTTSLLAILTAIRKRHVP